MNILTLKEICKFAAGIAAWESIVHLSFSLSGNIPLTFWGLKINQEINTIQIIVPALGSICLAYFAWRRA